MKITTVFLAIIIFSLSSFGAGDLKTQNLLIKKLTGVFLTLPDGNATKSKITLRLADLHAEKGRMMAKDELEKGCIKCSNGEVDRKKALEYYRYVLPTLKGEQKQNVMVQVGHIYEVLGKNNQAIGFYKKTAAGKGKGAAESQFSLGEIYFKKRNYSSAGNHYRKALAEPTFVRRGLATFRLAWCDYNIGKIAKGVQGLEKILTSPQLLTRGGETIVNEDQDFKAEVAKDYTVFVAHGSQLNIAAIKKVYNYSPESSRLENVSFLAKELERLGRSEASQEAWELVVSKTSKPQVRMEGLIYLAGLQFKQGKRDKVEPYLRRSFQNWQDLSSCTTDQCNELRKRVRRLVLDWNRVEKKKPSDGLIKSYVQYTKVAPKDLEVFELAAQAAVQAKEYELANDWLGKAYGLTTEKDKKRRETIMLRKIEVAELAKNPEWLVSSQKFYLKNSSGQSRSADIKYQMAQKSYDNKSYDEAAEQFRGLALSGASGKVRMQAAEMALDTLVILKQDSKIESWASEFAKALPQHKKRFSSIAGKSVLSQTAQLSGNSKDLEKAWTTLNRFDEKSGSTQEKITFHKNRIILARKLRKFSEMDSSIRSLLSQKGIEAKDRTFALENKVWVSEVQLNFSEALRSYQKLGPKKWLELARFADLAEKKSDSYYYKYLKNKPDEKIALSVCVKMIKEKSGITKPLRPCVPYLQKNKNLFGSLILEVYGNKQNPKMLNKTLARYKLQGTPAGYVINRSLLLEKGDADLKKLAAHKMDGRNSRVARSIKHRVSLITKFEKTISKATATKDWISQTVLLTNLKKQYGRFYEDLMGLPMPAGLTEAEQKEYLSILGQQAAPYKEKSDEIGHKLAQLWKNNEAIEQITKDFNESPIELQKILGPQIVRAQSIASEEMSPRFSVAYKQKTKTKLPSFALLETARQKVKNDPMDKSALKQLIDLEKARGYQPMIIYLNSRLKRVDEGFENKRSI